MKKLLLILWLMLPAFAFSQNQITLKSDVTFEADVKGFFGENLVFMKNIQVLGSDRVPILEVKSITGKVPKSRKKAILKKNPYVQFIVDKTDFEDDIYFDSTQQSDSTQWAYPPNPVKPYYNSPSNTIPVYSAGDYLYRAGKRYLTGLGVATGGAILTSVLVNTDNPDLALIGVGVSLTGIIISITGHIQLMEAGKALNREAITLSAAESGIGLAINF